MPKRSPLGRGILITERLFSGAKVTYIPYTKRNEEVDESSRYGWSEKVRIGLGLVVEIGLESSNQSDVRIAIGLSGEESGRVRLLLRLGCCMNTCPKRSKAAEGRVFTSTPACNVVGAVAFAADEDDDDNDVVALVCCFDLTLGPTPCPSFQPIFANNFFPMDIADGTMSSEGIGPGMTLPL